VQCLKLHYLKLQITTYVNSTALLGGLIRVDLKITLEDSTKTHADNVSVPCDLDF